MIPLPKGCRLLDTLSKDDLERVLLLLDAREISYKKGAFLHRAGEPMHRFGIVLQGLLQVFMEDVEGERMVMASVAPGESFGEALAYLRITDTPIFVEAVKDSVVLWLSPEKLHLPSSSNASLETILSRFMAMMAKKMLLSNDRIQVLSKRTLRKKLLAFFSQCVRDSGGARTFTVPFDRTGMADYLGADRAALSRELSNMKKEGLIDFSGNSFRLLFPAKHTDIFS